MRPGPEPQTPLFGSTPRPSHTPLNQMNSREAVPNHGNPNGFIPKHDFINSPGLELRNL